VLEVKSVNGDKFHAFKKLHFNDKKFSVFVQTDKSIYKPADNIQFRVLVLDVETKPFITSSAEIYITDGADNRIKQYENVKFTKGVFQNELQLSDSPVMGTWKIHVKINDDANEFVKLFDVAEYVLPKFEVTIDAHEDANFKDGKIRATVKAKYTFGKIAKGNATVVAQVENSYGWWRRDAKNQNKKVSKSVEVDGKKYVEFDINELGIEQKSWEQTVLLTASFTEELSQKEANATTSVTIHKTPHKITLEKSANQIKPGLPFKVSAMVMFHDKNTPVTDNKNPLKITTTYFYDVPRKCKRRKYYYRPYRPIRIDGVDDAEETTTTETDVTTTTEPEYTEYDCRDEKSYEIVKDFFVSNGKAEMDIIIPSNTTHINVKVS
jgi:CD109 antigen